MRWRLAFAILALGPAGTWAGQAAAQYKAPYRAQYKPPPLRNPALLNIGFVCRWQDRCIQKQDKAMRRALKYVAKYQTPSWKIQLCNRNSSRDGTRKDWVGFDNCVRNASLQPPRARRRRG